MNDLNIGGNATSAIDGENNMIEFRAVLWRDVYDDYYIKSGSHTKACRRAGAVVSSFDESVISGYPLGCSCGGQSSAVDLGVICPKVENAVDGEAADAVTLDDTVKVDE